MESRKAKILVSKSGGSASKNGYTYRATLPTSWIKEMGISQEERGLKLTFDGKRIIVEKGEQEG